MLLSIAITALIYNANQSVPQNYLMPHAIMLEVIYQSNIIRHVQQNYYI